MAGIDMKGEDMQFTVFDLVFDVICDLWVLNSYE
jgi:hypothetical protein